MIDVLRLKTDDIALYTVNDNAVKMKLGIREVTGMGNLLKNCKALETVICPALLLMHWRKRQRKKNPSDSRWDSQYDTMVPVLDLKDVIQNMCDEKDDWSD